MPILNYTTEVSVGKTIGEIHVILSAHGASTVETEYEGGLAVSVTFWVTTGLGLFHYRLPARINSVWQALVRESRRGKVPARFTTKEQAARVGWRIVKDWLEAQMAMVEADAVTIDEVMLPFHLVDEARTVYDVFRETRNILPAAEAGR